MSDEHFAVIHDWLSAQIAQRKEQIRCATIFDDDEVKQLEWEIEEFECCLRCLVREKDDTDEREEVQERQKLAAWAEKVKS